MTAKPNYLLEYAIDSLLKTFNSNRKCNMRRSHFFKLMNLLDVRLRSQGIDIELPGYWYEFGFYTELNFLDTVLPRQFTKFYMLDSEYIVPPLNSNRIYKIVGNTKAKIDSTIHFLWEQFKFLPDYGLKVKKESYKVNSPYKFNTIFQDYIDLINSTMLEKEKVEYILDSLLSVFPEEEFAELYDIYLEWDDVTRLILDNVHDKMKYEFINELMKSFWKTYSTGVKIIHNQYIPDATKLQSWKEEYKLLIPVTYDQIESTRKKVLLGYYNISHRNDDLVVQLMKKAYEMSMEAC